MKKSVALILTAALMFGAAGCSKTSKSGFWGGKKTVTDIDIEELKSREGKMFTLSSEVVGPIDWDDEDRITGSLFTVYWDGTIERATSHMVSDADITTRNISSEDYLQIYEFCEDSYNNHTYEDYTETDVCDGETYAFRYYPADTEEQFFIYYGYCYGNEDLMGIVDMVTSYFRNVPESNTSVETEREYTIDELKELSGNMLSIQIYEPAEPYVRDVPYVCYWIRYNGTIYRITHTSDDEENIWDETVVTDEDYITFLQFACGLTGNCYYETPLPVDANTSRWWVTADLTYEAGADLYSGPVEGCDGLQEMADLAASYFD